MIQASSKLKSGSVHPIIRIPTKAMTSGDAEKIYNKWFMNPIPPKGLNLSMPLSAEMKALYKAPNDKAFE